MKRLAVQVYTRLNSRLYRPLRLQLHRKFVPPLGDQLYSTLSGLLDSRLGVQLNEQLRNHASLTQAQKQ